MINKKYRGLEVKFRKVFDTSIPRGIQLNDFLDANYYVKLLSGSKPDFKHVEVRDEFSFFEDKQSMVEFFKSPEFIRFASLVSGYKLTKSECSLKIFMHGNYTLAHMKNHGKVLFWFDLTPNWNPALGGVLNFVVAEDRLVVPPAPNSLVLVDPRFVESYIKCVNVNAGENGRSMITGFLS